MTNPNNAIGTNAAYDGRTSVEAFNDVMGAFSRGLVSGWGCVPNTGLTVSLGGNGTDRDVAIAEDSAGNRTSINNRSGSPVDVTITAAPASNTRIDAIVAYVESSPTGSSTTTDNPAPCGIIPVAGTPSGSPVAPNDSAIRTAITADGASGTTAFYVILAYITIPNGTTDLTSANIAAGPYVKINAPDIIPDGGINNANLGPEAVETTNIKDGAVTSSKIDFTTLSVKTGDIPQGNTNLNLSEGKWLIFAYCTMLVSGQEKNLSIYKNGTAIAESFFGNTDNSIWSSICVFTITDVSSTDTIQVGAGVSSAPDGIRNRWIAIKLGAATEVI